ncbi:MAG: hypothetical protein JSU63_15805 [Phycisphaerales bacterium]|nr:MAG: hypothetical protein JSU63_15805 [Phycisphaerales bacterium]
MITTIDCLNQHQLVILRRLREHPLTEFELACEVAEHSGHSVEECSDNMAFWLEELRVEGLIWAGALTNSNDQRMMAAALTKRGMDLIG